MKEPGEKKDVDFDSLSNASLEFNESEFGASMLSGYSVTEIELETTDQDVTTYNTEDWCTSWSSSPTLSGGSTDSNICFSFDDQTAEYPFNPVTTSSPSCTDSGNIVEYQVSLSNSLDPETFKLTIDPVSNVIRVTGVTGGSVTTTQTITVKASLPDLTSHTFTFNVIPTHCASAVFTPSLLMTDQTYIVSDVYSDYTAPDFTSSDPTCSAAYTNSISPVSAWMTDSSGSGKVVGWYTTDDLLMGSYVVTITAISDVCSL